MGNFKLIVALAIIIGVVQVCTSSPVSVGEETDVTKMFTPEELVMARNAGIRDREMINGKTRGVSVEEMVKLFTLVKNNPGEVIYDDKDNDTKRVTTFEEMAKVCEIFAPQLKSSRNATKDQQQRLNELMESIEHFPRDTQFPYLRASVCSYLNKPDVLETDARSFGMKFVPYMKFRFWQLKNENATGVDRVNTAKELCCIYKGRDNVSSFKVHQSTAFSSSNEIMSDFEKHWNEFKTANTPKSFVKLCDFLKVTNPTDEC